MLLTCRMAQKLAVNKCNGSMDLNETLVRWVQRAPVDPCVKLMYSTRLFLYTEKYCDECGHLLRND
jgi:hypothetical protein